MELVIGIDWVTAVPYITIALIIVGCCVGTGIGQGMVAKAALEGIDEQPHATDAIIKTALLGMALLETSALVGIFIAGYLLYSHMDVTPSWYQSLAVLGVGLAVAIPGFLLGIIGAWPAQSACISTARQPFFAHQISRLMLITQSLIQTPILFGLIVAFFVQNQLGFVDSLGGVLRIFASGLAIGGGSIGPAIGLAWFAHRICLDVGKNPKIYYKLFYVTLVGESIIETPIIVSFLMALYMVLGKGSIHSVALTDGLCCLSSGLTMTIGALAPGIMLGAIAGVMSDNIARYPAQYDIIFKTGMLGLALVESCVVYIVIIAGILLI